MNGEMSQLLKSILPVIPVVLIFCIPIIAILSGHQRRMAELIHQRIPEMDQNVASELLAIRREMSEMRDRLNALTVASDRVQLPPETTTHAPKFGEEEAEKRLQ